MMIVMMMMLGVAAGWDSGWEAWDVCSWIKIRREHISNADLKCITQISAHTTRIGFIQSRSLKSKPAERRSGLMNRENVFHLVLFRLGIKWPKKKTAALSFSCYWKKADVCSCKIVQTYRLNRKWKFKSSRALAVAWLKQMTGFAVITGKLPKQQWAIR